MTYEKLVANLKKNEDMWDATNVKEHIAVQFNIYGEPEGALYIEIKDGVIDVQPYEYYDRDAIVATDAQELLALSTRKHDFDTSIQGGLLSVDGNYDKVRTLFYLAKKVEPKKMKKSVKKS